MVGIDNSNCTGMEERLVDCSFSREVSDCNSDTHKVGVRCHEESKYIACSKLHIDSLILLNQDLANLMVLTLIILVGYQVYSNLSCASQCMFPSIENDITALL